MIKINRPNCPNPTALNSGNYKHADNKKVLKNASYDKCMYCESKISHVYYGDVEHIQPKSIYPGLEFEWSNLGYVCAKCNGIKNNKYDESAPYVNPYEDDPAEHIVALGSILKHKRGSERGEITISDLGVGLNRTQLIEKRKEKISYVEKAINSCFRTDNLALRRIALEELKNECSDEKEYSLCIKALLRSHEII